jgi:hypothetical protein
VLHDGQLGGDRVKEGEESASSEINSLVLRVRCEERRHHVRDEVERNLFNVSPFSNTVPNQLLEGADHHDIKDGAVRDL